jgi:hypothetical protein
MQKGKFYFLEERYFLDFPDKNLMKNKESVDGISYDRPCFYAFQNEQSEIYWMIPISSKVEKYEKIHHKNILKYGISDTIIFGNVLNQRRAFLIQNMCPVTDRYIEKEYDYSFLGHIPVAIEPSFSGILEEKANLILALVRRGRKLIFPDVLKIEKMLLEQL